MSVNSLLSSIQGKYYNAIITEPVVSSSEDAENDRQEYIANAKKRLDERHKEHQKEKCTEVAKLITVGFIVVVFVIISLIFLSIICALLYVAICACIEYVIVSMFGRAAYNKNFPVCSSSIYTGNGCYTTTSTYCTN
jgi:Flp pilus assembly protein TadB